MATLVALVSGFKKENPDSIKDVDEVGADEGGAEEISFESLLIIYMLQNVIFILLKASPIHFVVAADVLLRQRHRVR